MASSASTSPRRILVVGDDTMMRLFLQNYLSDTYDVEGREDAGDALSWLQDGELVDLVITDVSAPELDSKAFTKQLRTDERFTKIPLLLVSSVEDSEIVSSCLEAGANDFVLKPFNPQELTIRVEHLFRRFG